MDPGKITDHPRVCGDNRGNAITKYWHIGPSPRVRGQRELLGSDLLHPRTIPACAGTTKRTSQKAKQHTDHPRVCGDNSFCPTPILFDVGPSPRVRGQPS